MVSTAIGSDNIYAVGQSQATLKVIENVDANYALAA